MLSCRSSDEHLKSKLRDAAEPHHKDRIPPLYSENEKGCNDEHKIKPADPVEGNSGRRRDRCPKDRNGGRGNERNDHGTHGGQHMLKQGVLALPVI